jgi:hypothetical protein
VRESEAVDMTKPSGGIVRVQKRDSGYDTGPVLLIGRAPNMEGEGAARVSPI